MSQTDIEQLELSIDAAKEIVARGQMAEKLADNPDFKKIVLDGYFRDEAARLALLSSDPNLPAESRGHIMNDLLGVGAFRRYLSTLVQMGRITADEIRTAREELDEMRAEELEAAE